MSLFYSFPAIVPHQSQILILGSMPSTRSIEQEQYYAHPQNAFWPLLATVYAGKGKLLAGEDLSQWQKGVHHKLLYKNKIDLLQQQNIALWDVLASCQRENSSDQSIRQAACNPIVAFLTEYPSLSRILLNGQKAANLFRRYIQVELLKSERGYRAAAGQRLLQIIDLPSSSPANAGLAWEQKLELWRVALLGSEERADRKSSSG